MQISNIEKILPEIGLSIYLDNEQHQPWKLCKHKCVSTGKNWEVIETFDTKEQALQHAETVIGFKHMQDVLDLKIEDLAAKLGIGVSTAYRYHQHNFNGPLVILAMRTLVRDYMMNQKKSSIIRADWSN